MATVSVSLPIGVRLPDMPETMECSGGTVAEALLNCATREPDLKHRIFHRNGSPAVGVSLNGISIPPDQAPAIVVSDGDLIKLLPPAGAC